MVGRGSHDPRGGIPGDVDSIPVDAQDSTCIRRGESLSAGQFIYVAQGGVLSAPGGWVVKGSLVVLGSVVEIGCQ